MSIRLEWTKKDGVHLTCDESKSLARSHHDAICAEIAQAIANDPVRKQLAEVLQDVMDAYAGHIRLYDGDSEVEECCHIHQAREALNAYKASKEQS